MQMQLSVMSPKVTNNIEKEKNNINLWSGPSSRVS